MTKHRHIIIVTAVLALLLAAASSCARSASIDLCNIITERFA